jgi:hypothetical protein
MVLIIPHLYQKIYPEKLKYLNCAFFYPENENTDYAGFSSLIANARGDFLIFLKTLIININTQKK